MWGSSRTSTIINGDVTFDGVSSSKISNLTVNGEIVVDNNSSSIYIHTLNAKDVIDIDLGSSHDIWFVTTQNSGYIELYCTSPLVDLIDSRNSESCGITVYGSDFSADDGYYENKSSWAIYCTSSSDPELVDLEFCSNDIDIYATSGCTVDATDVSWFSECPAPTGGSGTVNLPATCTSCPGALAKGLSNGNLAEGNKTEATGQGGAAELFFEALSVYRSINEKMRQDREKGIERTPQKYASDYQSIADKMKAVWTTYPESPYAIKALRYIDYCNRVLNRAHETSTTLASAAKSNTEGMRLEAKRLMVADLQRQKKYNEAIVVLDELIKVQEDVENMQSFIYRKGVIYQKYLKDLDKAVDFYSQTIDLAPDSPVAWSAQRRLDKMGKAYEPEMSSEEPTEELQFTATNYPNPANPGTTIHYILPEAGNVTLTIYNINGQRVATLVNAEMPAGRHTVHWNGRSATGLNTATGMYVYRLRFEDRVLSNKFLLLR